MGFFLLLKDTLCFVFSFSVSYRSSSASNSARTADGYGAGLRGPSCSQTWGLNASLRGPDPALSGSIADPDPNWIRIRWARYLLTLDPDAYSESIGLCLLGPWRRTRYQSKRNSSRRWLMLKVAGKVRWSCWVNPCQVSHPLEVTVSNFYDFWHTWGGIWEIKKSKIPALFDLRLLRYIHPKFLTSTSTLRFKMTITFLFVKILS